MKKILGLVLLISITLTAETLFEVKDSSNNKVLDVSTDGLRVFNLGDTLMVISASAIRANIGSGKGLSRTFSVTTSSAKNKGIASVLEVGTESTVMREQGGDQYTNFSPENIFLGINSGIAATPGYPYSFSGKNNVFIGNSSGLKNTEGIGNVYVGEQAGSEGLVSNNCTMIGRGAGYLNSVDNNVFIGNSAGFYSRTGDDNIFIGMSAGGSNDTGHSNVYIGREAGYGGNQYNSVGTGDDNVFIGDSCAYKSLHGNKNLFIGSKAGLNNTNANSGIYIGYSSGYSTNASENIFLGNYSGFSTTLGTQNTFIGHNSGYTNQTGYGNVFVGYKSGYGETGHDKLYIDNSDTTSPLIYGDFASDYIKINGRLGIGGTPNYQFYCEDLSTYSDSAAVYAKHTATADYGIGLKGKGNYVGVAGSASTVSFQAIGVSGSASGAGGTKVGVYGSSSGGGTNWAGYFSGNVNVSGSVTATSYIDLKVDYPLDPGNKILTHAGVNSDEYTNIYNGNAYLDSNGEATVKLPEWFEAFNTDFRYQITPVGQPAPGLYISKEVRNNSFSISGGAPDMKVSWQITCVRKDNLAKSNPVRTVTEKNDNEKGLYFSPDAFGMPEEKRIDRNLMRR